MDDKTAELVGVAIIFAIAALLLFGGAMDLALLTSGDETISLWLRRNPRWFYWPAIVAITLIVILWIHLFG